MPVWFRLAILAACALCACDDGVVHIVRFPSGRIREMWTEKGIDPKATARDGLFRSFFADGSRAGEIMYRAGKKHGAASLWGADGKLLFQGEYRDDFLVRETRYDSSGKASSDRRFTVKPDRVKAVGPSGDSMTVVETCAWSQEPDRPPVKYGLCTLKYADGRNLATRYYQSGRLNGPVRAWYPDGTPWLQGGYENDIPAGKWKTWSQSGNPLWGAAYVKGEKDGDWEEWFPDGTRKSKSGFRGGVPEGGYQEWYPNGKLRLRGQFRSGRREGKEAAWYPDGTRLYAAQYAAGKLEGDFYQWHPGGKLRLHCGFAKGRREGSSRIWYPGGGLQEQAYYKDGRLNESYRTWSADGAPMAMKEIRDGAVAFDSKAKELLDLLGADRLRVPVGMMGFYWGMGIKECRANLGLYQVSEVRAGDSEITAQLIAFPDRRPTRARIRLAFNSQGELWGLKLDLTQKSSADFFPLCENLEIEIGAELGTVGLRKAESGSGYSMTRKREWGRFTVTTGADGKIRQTLPVLNAEGFSPSGPGWFRFSLANQLYREYVNPANISITPPRWQEEAFLAGR